MLIINRIGHNIGESLSNIWGLITSLYFWIGIVLFLVLDNLDRSCSILIQLITLTNVLPIQIFLSLITFCAYFLVAVLAYKLYRNIQNRHHIHTDSLSLKRILDVIGNHSASLVLWLIAIIITSDVFSTIASQTSKNSGSTGNQDIIIKIFESNPVSAITMGVVAVILAPILEELINRGIFYNLFDFSHLNIITKTLVVILDGAIFSSGHITSDFSQFLIYFAMGVVLSLCYLTNHSLTCSTTLHLSVNLLVTILLFGSFL